MPPRRACKTCLNACWDKFERYGEPTVRFSDSWRRQMRDEARTLECEVKDLLNGKARGCQICYAIFRGISNLVWPAFRGPFERALSSTLRSSIILVRSRGRPLEVRADLMVDQPLPIGEEESYVSILPAPRGRRLITVTFEIYSEQVLPAPLDIFGLGRHVAGKLNSDRRQRLLREWIAYCDEHHPNCRPSRLEKIPPKRLLDLSGNPRTKIRLVDTQELDGCPYATLSHCWGQDPSQVLQLRKQNLADLMLGIRWTDLPPAFQDAVVTAAEQNIRYLWIDALCIIQDDDVDRQWHIAHRNEIYRQSYLNIGLTRVQDGRRTSFGQRWLVPADKRPVMFFPIELSREGRKLKVYARPVSHLAHTTFDLMTSPENTRSVGFAIEALFLAAPLFQSAWAFQELILSPRTVHFHRSEMAWQCRTQTKCECTVRALELAKWVPNMRVVETTLSSLRAFASLTITPKDLLEDAVLCRRLHDYWGTVMMFWYSRTRTSDHRERLQAIAGLAKQTQAIIREEYFAGLFANTRRELTRELLWCVQLFKHPAGRYSNQSLLRDPGRPYKVCNEWLPSWSWVSMIGTSQGWIEDHFVMRHGRDFREEVDICGVGKQAPPGAAENDDPFICKNWTLRVEGKVIIGRISTKALGWRDYEILPLNAVWFPRRETLPPPNPPGLLEPLPGLQQQHGSSTSGTANPCQEQVDWGRYLGHWPLFQPDCDRWDEDRRETELDTYAYFLLLGKLTVPGPLLDKLGVGIALRRATFAPGKFERIGIFTVPPWVGMFHDAQTHDLDIV